jgi:hypothetical protein
MVFLALEPLATADAPAGGLSDSMAPTLVGLGVGILARFGSIGT